MLVDEQLAHVRRRLWPGIQLFDRSELRRAGAWPRQDQGKGRGILERPRRPEPRPAVPPLTREHAPPGRAPPRMRPSSRCSVPMKLLLRRFASSLARSMTRLARASASCPGWVSRLGRFFSISARIRRLAPSLQHPRGDGVDLADDPRGHAQCRRNLSAPCASSAKSTRPCALPSESSPHGNSITSPIAEETAASCRCRDGRDVGEVAA